MDPLPPFTITPVLREAAELKIEELIRVTESFKGRYHLDAGRSAQISTVQRVSELLEAIKKSDPYLENDDDLLIMTRYIELAQHDKSVSESKLLKFEGELRSKLNKHLNRLEVSLLHVDLMKEITDGPNPAASAAAMLEKAAFDDDFEIVENELEEVMEKFERDTFTAKSVDSEAVETFLSSLFTGGRDSSDLENLREEMRLYGEQLMDGDMEVDQDVLMWIIMDLLKNNLISLEKKKSLEGFLQSPIALRELVATLNMKSFRHWNFRNAKKGLAVAARQNAEGRYCIAIDEEIIDLLFLHCTAIGWAAKLKECLTDFVRNSEPFKTDDLTADELNKREFFLIAPRKPIKRRSPCGTCNTHCPSPPLPPPPPQGGHMPYNHAPIVIEVPRRKSKKSPAYHMQAPPPPPPFMFDSLNVERRRSYIGDFFMSRLPCHEGCTPKVTRPEEVQAKLIKTLALEAKLRQNFGGRSYVSETTFESLAASLPHKTVLIVLKFLGIPDDFLDFFARFLEAKLNIGPSVRGMPDRILARTSGVPVGHGLELFFSEAVLFFLDLGVHKSTGSYLYRLHDKCYFVGTQEQHLKATEQIASFASVMGLQLKQASPGGDKMSIGCLTIDTSSETTPALPIFNIDCAAVMAYAHQVKKNLDACSTLLEWVRIWNSTVGTYASHLFGPLADILGKTHLEAVKAAYNDIFAVIFNGCDLTTHIKKLLQAHSNTDLSRQLFAFEALIYLPQAYGGLGVKNPFITLNLAHNVCENPQADFDKYLQDEEAYYKRAADNYNALSAEQRQQKADALFGDNKDRMNSALGVDRNLSAFMSRDELTAPRERAGYPVLPPPYPVPFVSITTPSLLDLYQDFLREPTDDIDVSSQVSEEISLLSGTGDMKSWRKLSGEERWVLGMYGAEAFEQYGTLEIWWADGVPKEVYKAVRGHAWSDGDDCDSSYESSII